MPADAAPMPPFYGAQVAQPHLGQPHHYRHHNNPATNFKVLSSGGATAPEGHITNPHQVPHLLDPLLRDKSNLGTVPLPDPSQSASAAVTIDVDSLVPPGYDKLMPPKENGECAFYGMHFVNSPVVNNLS